MIDRVTKRNSNKRKNLTQSSGGIFSKDKEVILERRLNAHLSAVNGALTNYYDKLTVFGNNLADKHIKNFNILINSVFNNVYEIGRGDIGGDIIGDIKITDGTEAAGFVLTSDANGLASWQAVSSGQGAT